MIQGNEVRSQTVTKEFYKKCCISRFFLYHDPFSRMSGGNIFLNMQLKIKLLDNNLTKSIQPI